MNNFKKWHSVGFSALMCLLVVGCTDKTEIIQQTKQAARTAFEMGFDCAEKGKSKSECMNAMDSILAGINDKSGEYTGPALPTGKYN